MKANGILFKFVLSLQQSSVNEQQIWLIQMVPLILFDRQLFQIEHGFITVMKKTQRADKN